MKNGIYDQILGTFGSISSIVVCSDAHNYLNCVLLVEWVKSM